MKIKLQFKTQLTGQLIRYLNLLLVLVFLTTAVVFGYFLYQNVYLSLQKIEKISSLKSGGLFTEDIEFDLYQQISNSFNQKQQGEEIEYTSVKNPFKPYQ